MQIEDFLKPGKVECFALKGLRRRIGDLVFRKLKSGFYISRRPKKPAYQTGGTKRNQQRLKNASVFAKKEMLDPEKKARYWEMAQSARPHMRNAYTAAVSVYMNDPTTVIRPKAKKQVPEVKKKQAGRRKFIKTSQQTLDRGPIRHVRVVLSRVIRRTEICKTYAAKRRRCVPPDST